MSGLRVFRLGHIRLPAHSTDPDDSDHSVLDGEWRMATCDEREAVATAQGLYTDTDTWAEAIFCVWSSVTDPSGQYGPPMVFTAWGSRDGTTPLWADARYPDKSNECEHAIYTITPPPEVFPGTHAKLAGLTIRTALADPASEATT